MGNFEILSKEDFVNRACNILGDNVNTLYLMSVSLIKFSSKVIDTYLQIYIDEVIKDYFGKYEGYAIITHKSDEILALFNADKDDVVINFYKSLLTKLEQENIINDIKRSCGVCKINDSEEAFQDVLYRANIAREEGINLERVIFFDENIMNKYQNETYIKQNFSTALENDCFKLYIQPKYDSESGRICGAEALSRWVVDDEIIKPEFYIPVLEASGRIVYLDFYIYEKTCEFLGKRIKNNLEVVPVSINFSQVHVFDDRLVDAIRSTADKYEVPYNLIHIEITESKINRNQEEEFITLEKLRSLGFSVELDDFGTGYSNLEMLTRMPVDIIKIDRTIFSNIKDQNFVYFYSCIINLAHKLGAKVTIEGVESINDLADVKNLAVDYIQGFYFSKPLLDVDFEFLLNTNEIQNVNIKNQDLLPFDIESLKRLFDNSMIPLYVVKVDDSNIKYLYANSAYTKIYDKTPRYFIGKNINDIFENINELNETFIKASVSQEKFEYYDITRNKKLYVKYTFNNIAPGYVCCMLEPNFSDNIASDIGILVLDLIENDRVELKYASEKLLKHFNISFEEYKKRFNVNIKPIEFGKIYKDVTVMKGNNNEDLIITFIVRVVYSIRGRINLICYVNDITEYKDIMK